MPKRKQPTIFALRRGQLIARARADLKILQSDLAEELGVSRNNLSMLEHGRIEQISERQARVLISRLGLTWSEVLENPAMHGALDDLAEFTPQARRVARSWDKLPPAMRDYLWSQIQAYSALAEKQPLMAQLIAGATPAVPQDDPPASKVTRIGPVKD